MDKSSKSRNPSVNNPETVPNAKKQHKPMDTKMQEKPSQSTISVHKNGDPIENVQIKSCNDAVQIEKNDAKLEISMNSLNEGTFPKSAFQMDLELKMRTVFTIRDKFRSRIPEPRSRNLSVNNREAVPNAKMQHKPTDTKRQENASQSTISLHKNSDSIENVQIKSCNDVLQIENHDAQLKISLYSLDEKRMRVSSSFLREQEIKMRAVQEKYRFRIPEPRSRNFTVNNREAAPNSTKQHKPKDTKMEEKPSQSTISLNKNNDSIENVQIESCNDAVQIENHDTQLEISMNSLEEGTLAKSSFLMDQEIKMRTVVTVQDKFRLRIPQPRNDIEKICRECKFYCLHEPRSSKPIVILDLDTLRMRRPKLAPSTTPTMTTLLEFLYHHFDIAVWSSLQMCDVIPKLEKYGFFDKLNKFFVNFVLDTTAMLAVYHPITDYVMVKDLKVIWNIYPQYSDKNCIMINNHLKKIIYKRYGVPLCNSKMDRIVDEVTMTVLIEFLIDTIKSKHSFANLNTPIWKQIKD